MDAPNMLPGKRSIFTCTDGRGRKPFDDAQLAAFLKGHPKVANSVQRMKNKLLRAAQEAREGDIRAIVIPTQREVQDVMNHLGANNFPPDIDLKLQHMILPCLRSRNSIVRGRLTLDDANIIGQTDLRGTYAAYLLLQDSRFDGVNLDISRIHEIVIRNSLICGDLTLRNAHTARLVFIDTGIVGNLNLHGALIEKFLLGNVKIGGQIITSCHTVIR